MTSDAKIGLLLGLVFIFIIAFIINGLPSLREEKNNNELTTNMVSSRNSSPGIGTRERKVSQEVINRLKPVRRVQIQPASSDDIRFTMPLPKSGTVEKELVIAEQSLPVVERQEVHEVRPSKPTLSKVYVVEEGDSLAAIAKKFYGAEDGNKKINIRRIFAANHKLLKTQDEIYVGQKLIIPPLSASIVDRSKIKDAFSSTIFKKVESIGKRHLSADGRGVKQGRQYVVREDDSLWRIAAEQLGDGNRYTEIARLNADMMNDEDILGVGMRLKLPAR